VNILVLGAGVIGASVADALAQRGADVTVLDMRGPGRGASQASAGILAPYTEADPGSPLLALGVRSLGLYDEFIEGVRRRSGRSVEYARTGTLEVAFDETETGRLEAARAWLAAEGVAHDWLSGRAIPGAEPAVSTDAVAALRVPAHGFVSVGSLIEALVHAARFSGAVFEAPVEVVSVTPVAAAGVEVSAGDRRWTADAVVVALGSWSGRVKIPGVPRVPVRPVRGQLLALDWRGTSPPSQVVWGPGCYTVPWSDGTLLVGATVEDAGFDESSTVSGVRSLLDAVARLFPATSAASIRDVRVGLRPAMADGLPAIGQVASGVFVATGHYRNGILLAPLTADVVSRLVLDGDEDPVLRELDPRRNTVQLR
jgi:glycine oxidase